MLKITINTNLYKQHNKFTNLELARLIKQKFNRDIDVSTISRNIRGISKSYVVHFSICEILNLDLNKIFIVENDKND